MPEPVNGKQSSACNLLVVKACMSLRTKRLHGKSVTVLRPCGVKARPRQWATIDPTFCRGGPSGDGRHMVQWR